jgi:ECF transporter S component (folate family)
VLVFLSLLIAMDVVLTHMLPVIQLDTIRISFGFLPNSFAAALFGPIVGGIGCALGDIIGMIIAPKGAYFPGFTLSALLAGMIYGFFLFRKPKSLLRISLAVFCIVVLIDIGLNTYWLTFLLGKGFLALLPARIIKSAAMLPVQVSVIYLFWRYAGNMIENLLHRRTVKQV